ncbi:MAG: aminoacyl-tRNA deacylase [Thermomicrobiales bacterium]|nr:aminoacyl-tRNA deacylase [Thermomicrobiales bacterium]
MPSVELAAAAIGAPTEQILKTLVFADPEGHVVVAVASGLGRVDRRRLATAIGCAKLTMAPPDIVLRVTGYPAGGVCPVGHRQATPVVVDRAAAVLPVAYGGGGDERLLLRIAPADIVRLTGAVVADIVQSPT